MLRSSNNRGRAGRKGRRRADDRLVVGGPHSVEAALTGSSQATRVVVEDSAPKRALAIAERARRAGIPVDKAHEGECDRLTGVEASGIAAEVIFRYAELVEVRGAGGLIVLLDGVEDPHNLGAVVRTAEAAGAVAVVIPARRAVQVTAAVVRVSAGAALALPVVRVANIGQAVETLGRAGYRTVGLDQEAEKPLETGPKGEATALVVGAEGAGLSRLVAARCQELARLPMAGRVGSLNASVAAGIAIYKLSENRL